TLSVSITGTSTQSGTANCTAGIWSYTPTTALSADGSYTVTVTQTDQAGNTGTTGPKTISVDRTIPVVTLTNVNGTARTFPLAINVTVTTVGGACGTLAGDGATVSVTLTGASTESGSAACSSGAWTYTFSNPLGANGLYSVTATQLDTAGNNGTSGAKS